MSYDRKHWEEMKSRLDRVRSSSVPLMNDTKWREVFLLIANGNYAFQISWLHRHNEWSDNALHSVWSSWVQTDGIKDPGIGGPCLYRNIRAIRIPSTIVSTEIRDGSPYRQDQRSQDIRELEKKLQMIGKLPMTMTPDFIEISGYKLTGAEPTG